MQTIGSPMLWGVFALVVVVALLIDLVLMRHGGPHKVTFKEATWWSLGWVALALAFNVWLWWYAGQQYGAEAGNRIGMEFLTGYLVEKSLAVDNIFVFLMIFSYFAVPEVQRQKVLIIGIIGAIFLRAILIFAGALLLAKFHWILYVFGAFLLLTGVKMMMAAGQAPDLDKNPVLRWLTAHVPFVRRYHGSALWLGSGARRKFTPLFIVIVMIGDHRRDLRGGFDPRNFRDHRGPLHRADLQRVRGVGPARDVLPAAGHGRTLPPAAVRAGAGADVHRRQDAAGRCLQDPGVVGAGGGGGHHRHDRGAQPVAATAGG